MKENILLAAAAVVGIGFCLRGIRQNQLGPHQVNHYVAGTLRNSMVVTNPEYLTYEWSYEWTNGAVQMVPHVRTNFYWRVWSIWR